MPSVVIPKNEPREYVHHTCGYTTIMPDEVIQAYLADPYTFDNTTFCANCKRQVPDTECTWVESGEQLRSYMERLQRQHVPVASAEGGRSFNLNVRGLSRYLALIIFFACIILPVESLWKDGKLDPERNATQMGRIGPRLGRMATGDAAPSGVQVSWYLWPIAVMGSIVALMLYCPGWGFKRYALLCGPIAGIGALMFLSYWLTGRHTIYRFEPIVVAMAGATPGIALWTMLVLRKAANKGLRFVNLER